MGEVVATVHRAATGTTTTVTTVPKAVITAINAILTVIMTAREAEIGATVINIKAEMIDMAPDPIVTTHHRPIIVDMFVSVNRAAATSYARHHHSCWHYA